jgi:hypothetical protein
MMPRLGHQINSHALYNIIYDDVLEIYWGLKQEYKVHALFLILTWLILLTTSTYMANNV